MTKHAHERFGLYTYDDWVKGAARVYRPTLAPFTAKLSGDIEIRIEPRAAELRGVTVVGGDWIPVLSNGRATLDHMVHTPALYIDKMRNIVPDGDGYRMVVTKMTASARTSVLVGGSRNYYHWLINCVPRLLWARKLGLVGSRALLINSELTPFQRETLELLKVPEGQCIEVADDEAIVCPTVFAPTLLAQNTVVHPAVPAMLRSALPASRKANGKRIFVRRAGIDARSVGDELPLQALLESYGFESVCTTQLSVQQQIDHFAGAAMVVGTHGVGLTNIVFCSPGAQVIEIHSPLKKLASMQMLSAICGHHHSMVPAVSSDLRAASASPEELQVDVPLLTRELERAVRALNVQTVVA